MADSHDPARVAAAMGEFAAALDALYNLHSTTKTTKEEANAWLEKFQHAPEAWAVCDTMLRNQDSRLEAKIFCAQTLRAKTISDFRQFGSAAKLAVRDNVLSLLHAYRHGPNAVVTQLCLALVAIAMQLREWTDVVPQMVEMFGKDPESFGCLIEFLSALALEVDVLGNRLPISDDDYRYQAHVLLTKTAGDVLQMLTGYIQQSGSNVNVQKKIFACLAAWCKEIPVLSLADSPLLSFSFDALLSDDLFEEAVDVLCEIIRGSSDIPESMPLINAVYPRLVTLIGPLKQAKEEEDDDKLTGYLRIFVGAGEAYIPLILEHYDAFQCIMEGIMECTSYHDLDLVPKTFNFWYDFGRAVVQQQHTAIKVKAAEIYRKLYDIMLKHLRYPEVENWTAEARDDFRNFRHEMGDVLKDCCDVLGQQEALERAFAMLSGYLPTAVNQNRPSWQEVEAALFAVRAMGSRISHDENVVLPKLMGILDQLPPHPKIRYCATLVIARYASWTAAHPEFIPFQLRIISSGFDNDEVLPASVHALKYLCQECNSSMVNYLQELHPFYVNAASNKVLTFREVLEVTEAFAHVIAAIQPPEEMLATLQTFCLSIAQKLHDISAKGQAATHDDMKIVQDLLDQLAVFFQFVQPVPRIPLDKPHPVVAVYDAVWPILDSLITHFGGRTSVAESITHCLRYVVAVSDPERFMHTVPRLLARTIAAFESYGLGCYLWLAGKCAQCYAGASEAAAASMLESLESLSAIVFSLFTVPGKGLQDMPDVVEDYFSMMNNFLQAAPKTLVSSQLLNSVVQCSLAAMELESKQPLLAVIVFLRDVVALASPRTDPAKSTDPSLEPLRVLLRTQGPSLVNQLFRGVFFTFPRDLVQDVGMVVKILGDVLPQETYFWVREIIEALPPDQLTSSEKAAFLGDFECAMQDDNIKRIRRILTDLQTLYRRKNVRPSVHRQHSLNH